MSLFYQVQADPPWQQAHHWQPSDTPFMNVAFWQALLDTGAIGEQAGWLPLYVQVMDDAHSDQPVAVMPVFVKDHHQGEFVFDHAWAQAYARLGLDYYPRLVTSAPYSPITGERLWLAPGHTLSLEILTCALAGVDDIAKQTDASSWHGLFVDTPLASLAQAFNHAQIQTQDQSAPLPLLERQGCQFLWHNQNITDAHKPFANFEDFLATLTAKKRKTIRNERKKVAAQQLRCHCKTGMDINQDDLDAFYHCYVMTYAVRGQQPYLTPDFFAQLLQHLPKQLMLAQALDAKDDIVASSLFLYDQPNQSNATLYGRYWGALGEYDSLHFELCYYQGIEFAIAQGLAHFDPGTQGEHKLIRGFVPTPTHSLHRVYDARLVPAIAQFCEQDREYMAQYRQQAHQALPFNADNTPAFLG